MIQLQRLPKSFMLRRIAGAGLLSAILLLAAFAFMTTDAHASLRLVDEAEATPVANVGDANGTVSTGVTESDTSGTLSTGSDPEDKSETDDDPGSGDSEETPGDLSETDTSLTSETGESEDSPSDVGDVPEASETESDEDVDTADVPEAFDVTVTVFNCETDPGDTAGASHPDCVVVPSAGVSAKSDAGFESESTEADGMVVFTIASGLNVEFRQVEDTLAPGYLPRGDGTVVVLVDQLLEVELVNVAEEVLAEGRFQVASGQCYTLGEPHTTFMVVGPMIRAADASCGPLGGADFLVTGGSLAEPLAVVTDGEGNWAGYLEPGEYQIARGGATESFSINLDEITVVVAIDYVTGPKGTLSIQRFSCTEGETSGVSIVIFDGGGGGPPDASCVPSQAFVYVYSPGSSAQSLLFDLTSDAATASVEMAAGNYVIQDSTGLEQAVSLEEGSFIQAIIAETVLTGVVAAQVNHCPDSSSNFENPEAPEYWSSNCGPASAGSDVAIVNVSGAVVASGETGDGGSAYFENVPEGRYTLQAEGQCAVFAGGQDARGGFTVTHGVVVAVAAYECALPSAPNPPGGNNGGSQNGGSGTGSLGSMPAELLSIGSQQPGSDQELRSKLYVHTLPATGADSGQSSGQFVILLATAAMALIAGGLLLAREHRLIQSSLRVRQQG